MKNLLGKFHADASAWPCSVPVASLVGGPGGPWPPQNFRIFLFLSGKFHEKFVRKISCRKHASAWPCSAGLPLQKKWHLQHGQNLLSQHI